MKLLNDKTIGYYIDANKVCKINMGFWLYFLLTNLFMNGILENVTATEIEIASPTEVTAKMEIVIWNFHVGRDSQKSLSDAVETNFITHASLYISNRWTGLLLKKNENREKLKWAIEMCRTHGIKTILVRNLWPTYSVPGADETIIFDPSYYIMEIQNLRKEGEQYVFKVLKLKARKTGKNT